MFETDSINYIVKLSKGAKIRNRYSQVPHLTLEGNCIHNPEDWNNKSIK